MKPVLSLVAVTFVFTICNAAPLEEDPIKLLQERIQALEEAYAEQSKEIAKLEHGIYNADISFH